MAQGAKDINRRGQQASVTYSTDGETEFGKIFFSEIFFNVSTVCRTGKVTISIQAEWLQISDAPRKQNESI